MEERRTDYYGQDPRPPRPMYPQGQGYGQAQGYGQRQGYMPAVRPIPPMPEQTPVLPVSAQGIRQLTRAERAEAARIAAESEFTFEGYQVVRREFFSHRYEPTLTIKENSILFNNAAISKLDQVVYIQMLVNPATEKLVIRPCAEGAKDAIRWCVVKGDKRRSREITCGLFIAKLYDMMKWEQHYRYKLQGARIDYNGEMLYIFDLTSTEAFLPSVKDPETAKRRPSKPMYPEDWRDSFGMSVREHTRSTQIDLMEGYNSWSQEEPLVGEILDDDGGPMATVLQPAAGDVYGAAEGRYGR